VKIFRSRIWARRTLRTHPQIFLHMQQVCVSLLLVMSF